MSHSILTKSNRASCTSSLRASADILLIPTGLGTGPWSFNSTLQCAFSSSFLPYLLSPLVTLVLVLRGQKQLLTQRRIQGILVKALQTCEAWKAPTAFPRLTSHIPPPCSYIAGPAAKGQGPTFCRCSFRAWFLHHSQHKEGHLQPRAGELAGVCFHPAAPPPPPSATDKCSNSLRECSFSNTASWYSTYFKLKGNYSGKSHKKQVTCWKIPAYISLLSLTDQSDHF